MLSTLVIVKVTLGLAVHATTVQVVRPTMGRVALHTLAQGGHVIQVQEDRNTQVQAVQPTTVREAPDILALEGMHTMVPAVPLMMVPAVLVILDQVGRVIQGQVALEKIALVFAGKNIPTHNKANALGQQKAPLVPRSAFCCR